MSPPPAPAAPEAVRPRHFLTIGQLDHEGLRALLDLAGRVKRNPPSFRNRLAGGRLGMLFERPSTRTRVSFESAAWLLGMLPIVLRPDELQLGRGETTEDTARALSLYLDALVVRTSHQAQLETLSAAASIPIINALTNEHHPCQALADVLTLEEEFGTLAGVQVAFVGDGDNVCQSLLQAAAIAGFALRIATPPGYEPDATLVAAAREEAVRSGAEILLTHDPAEAVFGAEAVYADVWVSMGHDDEATARRAAFAGFRVDSSLMARASRAAIFLHCLPAHRGEEVTDDVIDGPASRVWRQAENRMHTEAALLYAVLTGDLAGHLLDDR